MTQTGETTESPGVTAGPATAARRHSGLAFTVAVTVLDVGVALAAYEIARAAGAGQAAAYLAGSIGPLLGALAVWLRARTVSGASVAVLAFTLLSAAAVLAGSHDPRMLLYKDAVVTAVIGAVFAVSLACPRPLAFYFGQRFLADGTREGMRAWAAQWPHPLFRRANYLITTVWAATYLLDAAGKSYLISSASYDTAYTGTQLLPLAAAGAATVTTFAVIRHYTRAASSTPTTQAEAPRRQR